MGRRRELPRDRAEVYKSAVSLLVEHWDVEAKLFPSQQGLLHRDKLDLLRRLAAAMQGDPHGLAGNRITEVDLRDLFEAYLIDERGYTPTQAHIAAEAMIAQLRERNYILARFGAGSMYGFVHRAFLEYMAAADIVDRFDNRHLTEDQLLDLFTRRGGDPAWAEVLLLVVGMKDQFAGKIIDRLLTADPGWWFETHHRSTHSWPSAHCVSCAP